MVAEILEEKVQQEKHDKINSIAYKGSNIGCIHEANMKDSVVEANFGSNILIIYNSQCIIFFLFDTNLYQGRILRYIESST